MIKRNLLLLGIVFTLSVFYGRMAHADYIYYGISGGPGVFTTITTTGDITGGDDGIFAGSVTAGTTLDGGGIYIHAGATKIIQIDANGFSSAADPMPFQDGIAIKPGSTALITLGSNGYITLKDATGALSSALHTAANAVTTASGAVQVGGAPGPMVTNTGNTMQFKQSNGTTLTAVQASSVTASSLTSTGYVSAGTYVTATGGDLTTGLDAMDFITDSSNTSPLINPQWNFDKFTTTWLALDGATLTGTATLTAEQGDLVLAGAAGSDVHVGNTAKLIMDGGLVVLDGVTGDPCGASAANAGGIFYNATAGVPCYCDNAGADLKMVDGSACF